MREPTMRVAILVISDRAARGERADATGPRLAEAVRASGAEVVAIVVLPDEAVLISAGLIAHCEHAEVVLTAGGTGLAERDVTPEATADVVTRQAPGMAEAMRAAGLRHTPHAMLSRGIVGVRGHTLIINLPGSPKGAVESLEAIWAAVPHAVALLRGPVTDDRHTAD